MNRNDLELQQAIDSVNNGTRNSGRTTRQAFSYVDQMLAFPDTPVKIVDHFNSPLMNRELTRKVRLILDAAGVPYNMLGETIMEIPKL